MSDQQDTEASKPCISSAPKSLGQVGYEAMLARVKAYAELSGHNWISGPSELWENNPPRVRDDWEAIALAIEVELKAKLVKEIAEQMTPKKPAFRYDDLSTFKPSPEFETALKKAMDQFRAWSCPKCGAPGRVFWPVPHLNEGFFLETANTYKVGIVCSEGCDAEQMGAKL